MHPQRLTVCPALERHDSCKTILSFWDGTFSTENSVFKLQGSNQSKPRKKKNTLTFHEIHGLGVLI